MITMCAKCGNYNWDKQVSDDKTKVQCPKCGFTWNLKSLPLFILTGCSGVGKTTTGLKLQQMMTDVVVLDADFFTFMPSVTQEDWNAQVEKLESISADIMQCGKPVLWTMAGNLDRLNANYMSQYFSHIYCLALTCEEEELRRRMHEGRGIEDEGWIQSSVDYNRYFMEHDKIGDLGFEKIGITGKNVDEVAVKVIDWIREYIN